MRTFYYRFLLCALLMLATICEVLDAQTTKRAQGIVLSTEDGLAVIGASVVVEGTTIGTVTDLDGKFSLQGIPASAKKLRVSYVGMTTKEVNIGERLRVLLDPAAELVDEVVVVAYGTAKKTTFTGSAAVVNTEQIDRRPVTDVTSSLLGSASGVTLNTASGMPGESATIRVRGIGSINGSSDPLIILDGVPYDGSLSSLNPSDIASLTVLKDAASSALYGSRAANGVIMITSKNGKSGKAHVNVKLNQGFTWRGSTDYERLSTTDYLEIYWEMLRNNAQKGGADAAAAAQTASNNLMTALEYNPFVNVEANTVVGTDGRFNTAARNAWSEDTDWEDAMEQTGNRTDASVAVNGGSDKTDYYFSAGYTSEEGYVIGSRFKRLSAKANVNSQIKPWLKAGLTAAANLSDAKGMQTETRNSFGNPFFFTRYISPLYPIHLHDATTGAYILDATGRQQYDFGSGYDDGTYMSPVRSYASPANPAIELQERDHGYARKMFNVKTYAAFKPYKDVTFTANANVMSNAYLGRRSDKVFAAKGNAGSASRTNTFTTTYTFNQLLEYKPSWGDHHLDLLLGHESYKYEYNYLTASMKGEIMSDNSELVNYTEVNDTPSSYTHNYRTEGYFSRLTYDYDGRYFASASFRRDGTSRFYKDSRWGNFYSVGAGWTLNREAWLKDVKWIDNLKLRFSYGEVGNDNVGNGYYPWVASYKVANNGTSAGYVQSSLGNRELQWEVSQNSDLAVEFGLFHLLSGSVELFNRQSSNMLFEVPLSPSSGFDSHDMNAGTMYNRGLEFNLTAHVLKSNDWKVDLNVNGTLLKNKITELPVDAFMLTDVSRIEEGHSLYEFYLRDWQGVSPETGNALYTPTAEALESSTHLETIGGKTYTSAVAEADYTWAGYGTPTMTGGFGATASWKGLSLNLAFYYQLGGKCYDIAYYNLMRPNQRSYNTLSSDILKRWQQPGDVTDVPRLADANETDLYGEYSTRWLTSSNLLELATASLSYNLPKHLIAGWGIESLTIYCSGDNLFQVTSRQGIYPRQYASGYTNNADTYAPARSFTFGLNLSF